MIAGIRYPNPLTQYPRFVPWAEVKGIGIYEATDEYILAVERQHGDDVDLLYSRDLAAVEALFESLVDSIASAGTVIEMTTAPAPEPAGPCEHEAERVAYAGDQMITYHICQHRRGLHPLPCPTPAVRCAVRRDRDVWGGLLP